MKIANIKTKELKLALALLTKIVNKKHELQILRNVKLEIAPDKHLTLTATDLDNWIDIELLSGTTQDNISTTVNLKELKSVIRRISSLAVDFNVSTQTLTVSNKSLNLLPIELFPHQKGDKDFPLFWK